MSFSQLQLEYNKYRDDGGDHATFLSWHEINPSVGEELRVYYEHQPRQPVTHRERFQHLAAVLDQAMADPGITAMPAVAHVLDLLCKGLIGLAQVVITEIESQ